MQLLPLESGKIPAFITLDVLPKPPGSILCFRGDLVFFFRRRTGNITVINWRTKAEAIFHVQDGEEVRNRSEFAHILPSLNFAGIIVAVEPILSHPCRQNRFCHHRPHLRFRLPVGRNDIVRNPDPEATPCCSSLNRRWGGDEGRESDCRPISTFLAAPATITRLRNVRHSQTQSQCFSTRSIPLPHFVE